MGFRGQLSTSDFEGLLRRNGELPLAYMRRLGQCPNSHSDVMTGFSADADCALCGGTGEVFESVDLDAVAAASGGGGKLLLLNAKTSKTRSPVELIAGDLQCSYLPGDYEMAGGDRLQLATRDVWNSQLLRRDDNRDGGLTDNLIYWPVLSIGSVVVSAGALAADKYTVSENSRGITFDAGAVTAGAQYLVRYRYRPQWVVVENSHVRRVEADDGDRFPNRCILRLWQGHATDVAEADL